jgi:hypothetical protein
MYLKHLNRILHTTNGHMLLCADVNWSTKRQEDGVVPIAKNGKITGFLENLLIHYWTSR